MKFYQFFSLSLWSIIGYILRAESTFAAGDNAAGIYDPSEKSQDDLRTGTFSIDDIPNIIVGVIEIAIGLAGTLSIFALIYHAFQMQLSSGITGDSTGVEKAKAGMKGALLGFALALSAWFLVTKFVEILAQNT